MNRALVSVSCLVLAGAAIASGCVDQDTKGAAEPTDAPGMLCAQMGFGRGPKGADLYTFEPIHSFEQEDEDLLADGDLVYDDDETLDGDGVRCAGQPKNAVYDFAHNDKERWNQNGDGVVAFKDLVGAKDPLAQCQTVTKKPNKRAFNFWGPYTTKHSEAGDQPADGYAYSGGTIPIFGADYSKADTSRYPGTWDKGLVVDASKFKGIAFWARLARADEAVNPDKLENADEVWKMADLNNGGAPGADPAAAAQDGQGLIEMMVQTVQTSAFEDTTINDIKSSMADKSLDVAVDLPETRCIDYDPWQCAQPSQGSTAPGQVWTRGMGGSGEVGFRDQCWDGFRTEVTLTYEWKFYVMPFKDMRQAGWGRVADEFRTDQIRSISVSTGAFQTVDVLIDEVSFYR